MFLVCRFSSWLISKAIGLNSFDKVSIERPFSQFWLICKNDLLFVRPFFYPPHWRKISQCDCASCWWDLLQLLIKVVTSFTKNHFPYCSFGNGAQIARYVWLWKSALFENAFWRFRSILKSSYMVLYCNMGYMVSDCNMAEKSVQPTSMDIENQIVFACDETFVNQKLVSTVLDCAYYFL